MPRKPTLTTAELEQELARVQRALRKSRAGDKKQARADDARAKIIEGALSREHREKNPNSEFARIMTGLLKEYVRENERHLFPAIFPPQEAPALPPVAETEPPAPTEAAA